MFNGDTLRDAIISAANNLTNNRKQIDDLNVFPVPDGDTGTNMSMTLANSVRELEKLSGAIASVKPMNKVSMFSLMAPSCSRPANSCAASTRRSSFKSVPTMIRLGYKLS